MQTRLLLIFSSLCGLVGGFVGGYLASHVELGFSSPVQAQTSLPHLQAQSFDLIDAKGKLRAQLALSKEGPPGLFLIDDQGRSRGVFALYPDGSPHLVLNDRSQNATHVLRTFGAEEAPLVILKNRGQDQLILGLNPSGLDPFLMHYEKSRQRKLEFGKYDGP